MTIFIIGGMQEVYFLSKAFLSKGYKVIVVNEDELFCRRLSRKLNLTAVVGDGSQPYVLEEAGLAYADIVIALKEKDPDNLVICQIAQKMYGINNTFAIVKDPQNIQVFQRFGVNRVLSTSHIISSLIEHRIDIEDIQNLMPIGEGGIVMMQVDLREEHPVLGKSIEELDFPEQAIIGCILRKQSAFIPKGATTLQAGDSLIVLCQAGVQSSVMNTLHGRVD